MLENAPEIASACTLCGACVEVCPFFKATNNPKFGAMAKVEAAIALFEGKELKEEDLKTLYLCTRCDGCHNSCPMDIPISVVVQAARAELRRRDMVPEKYKTIADAIIKMGSPMAAPPEKRTACLPEGFKPPEKAKYLYVPGCWSGIKLPETAKATMEVLIEAGLDFTTLGEKEWCCGLFLIDTGMLEEAKGLAEKNTVLFESTGARTVVTECPSCYDVFKNVYPALFRKPDYEVVHISELLDQLVKEGRISPSAAEGKRIIYKDPCPLVRRTGTIQPPRDVLRRIGDLVEYGESGKEAVCCGAPAGVKPLYPDIANKLAEMLMSEAKAKGAEVGVGCAFCMYHMGGLPKEAGYPPIKTLSQLVLESLKK
ncbi:MAG: (Fe-S)-binding protein [Candidatus Methanosuratincola petrocarbonis]